jgi:hypothetical protein
MESSSNRRSGWLTAGGVLSIVGGAFEVVGAGMGVAVAVSAFIWSREHPVTGVPSIAGISRVIIGLPIWSTIAAFGVALGVVAIVGGVSALRRKRFGLSLAGAICALPSGFLGAVPISIVSPARGSYALPSVILGILAIIFIYMSKKEFGKGGEQSGI